MKKSICLRCVATATFFFLSRPSSADMADCFASAREEVRVENEKAKATEEARRRTIVREALAAREPAFLDMVSKGLAKRFQLGNGITLDLIRIGEDEGAYFIGRFEVTQAQYEFVTGSNPSFYTGEGREDHPVERVTWNEAVDFCRRLNSLFEAQRGDSFFSLPTSMQWEKAAVAARGSYAGGNNLAVISWYTENSDGHTHAVGSKRPTPQGIYDLSGNVNEWCLNVRNCWRDEEDDGVISFFGVRIDMYEGLEDAEYRGGGWNDFGREPMEKMERSFKAREPDLGFRVVLVPSSEKQAAAAAAARERERKLRAAEEQAFLEKVRNGEARRVGIGDGVTLDLIRLESEPRDCYIGRFEITQRQYLAVMGANPSSHSPAGDASLPVENVSWSEAVDFCKRLTERLADGGTPLAFTLPGEEQWRMAARAGQDTPYAGGFDLYEVGWFAGNSSGRTHAVGQKKPNRLGLYDMNGNVSEWISSEGVECGGDFQASGDDCKNETAYVSSKDWREKDTGFRVMAFPGARR